MLKTHCIGTYQPFRWTAHYPLPLPVPELQYGFLPYVHKHIFPVAHRRELDASARRLDFSLDEAVSYTAQHFIRESFNHHPLYFERVPVLPSSRALGSFEYGIR
jgi:hypothetical protein